MRNKFTNIGRFPPKTGPEGVVSVLFVFNLVSIERQDAVVVWFGIRGNGFRGGSLGVVLIERKKILSDF